MSKPAVLTEKQWRKLYTRIKEDYPPSVWLIRDKSKKVLGFTVREHREWIDTKGYRTTICLDFYDEPKRTMFLLKYSEYINETTR